MSLCKCFLTLFEIYAKIRHIFLIFKIMYTWADRKIDFESGAATLLLRLDEKIQDIAAFWQNAVKWNHAYLSQEQIKTAQNIKSWYDFQKSFSYSSNKYRIDTKKTLLLQNFKQDPNYIFKNIVEMLVRKLLKDHFLHKWVDAKVFITSDADDVFAGVDIIIETWNTVFWVDVCCTEKQNTINKKTQQSISTPIEYNIYKNKHPLREIPRLVYPISGEVLWKFMQACMNEISKSWSLSQWKALRYFQSYTKENTDTIFKAVLGEYKQKIKNIL